MLLVGHDMSGQQSYNELNRSIETLKTNVWRLTMKLSIATQDSHKSMSVIQEAIRQFRLDNPEVSFDIQIHSSREQLYKHISGENPPDIVEWNGPNIGLRLDSGILTDLSEEINRDGVNMEDYFPSAVKAITNQDRIGALPVMTKPSVYITIRSISTRRASLIRKKAGRGMSFWTQPDG
jgi:maltose-binding protein MalE